MKALQEPLIGKPLIQELDVNKQPRVNYISPSKIGVIQKPNLSKEVVDQAKQ